MSLDDFKIIKKLGVGSYSSVYKIIRNNDGLVYALKKIKMGNLSDKEKENSLNEVRILASIDHPYIVSYKEAFIDEDSSSLCIIMEYADDGDLFQKIMKHQEDGTLFSEADIFGVFTQVVKGL
jgi:NIMA (never in mitosis gene a)-related kinase